MGSTGNAQNKPDTTPAAVKAGGPAGSDWAAPGSTPISPGAGWSDASALKGGAGNLNIEYGTAPGANADAASDRDAGPGKLYVD